MLDDKEAVTLGRAVIVARAFCMVQMVVSIVLIWSMWHAFVAGNMMIVGFTGVMSCYTFCSDGGAMWMYKKVGDLKELQRELADDGN